VSDGVYKVTIGGVAGTLDVLTRQFTPADFEATFNALAPKARTSATKDYTAGTAPDTYQVTITSVIDLDKARRERYDWREGRLVLTAQIRHTVTQVASVSGAEPLPGGLFTPPRLGGQHRGAELTA
jgi:hypothetical protein